jgi:UDP-glucose 4-epimerase
MMTSPLPSFEKAQVLITGGLGFIGSTLARRLVSLGASVVLVDSLIPEYGGNLFNINGIEDRLVVNISDVRDEHGFNHLIQGKDFLFNLAGQTSHADSMVNPFADLEINCRSQLSILESCRRYNATARIIFASTRQIYGKPRCLPVDEEHPLLPVDVNGINKLAGEMYHTLYQQVYGLKTCSLRLTNTYGPRMRVKDARQTFLGLWIRQLIDGDPLQVYGDGSQLRDFNYVDDVVDALLLASTTEAAVGKVFNLGSREVISLKELASLLIQINGSGHYAICPFPEERARIDIGSYYGDYARFKKITDWEPGVALRDGLSRTLDYYRQYFTFDWTKAAQHERA